MMEQQLLVDQPPSFGASELNAAGSERLKFLVHGGEFQGSDLFQDGMFEVDQLREGSSDRKEFGVESTSFGDSGRYLERFEEVFLLKL